MANPKYHKLHFCVPTKGQLSHMSKLNLTVPDSFHWDLKSDNISRLVAPYVNAGPTNDNTSSRVHLTK